MTDSCPPATTRSRPPAIGGTSGASGDVSRGDEPAALNEVGEVDVPEFAAMKGLVRRANAGDKAALRGLLAECKGYPKRLIWYGFGDLAKLAEGVMLDAQLSHNPASRLAVEERMREIRRDLGGAAPTPLERLLISRIALAWLDVHTLDVHAAQNKDYRPKVIEALDRRRERAERRYIRAIKTLAAVRNLDPTAIQVNVSTPPASVRGRRLTGRQVSAR
jgi:hypothetical protein